MTAHHSMLQLIASGDHKLMRKVNKWPAPRWIRLSSIAATRAGDGWLWYLTGLMILLFGGDGRLTAIASAGSAALVGVGLFILLKNISGRKRPCEIEPHVWAHLRPPDQFSFPSGHTAAAVAFGSGVSRVLPSAGAPLHVLATLVGYSRVHTGVHYPGDVVAGAVIGAVIAGLTAKPQTLSAKPQPLTAKPQTPCAPPDPERSSPRR